MSLILSGTNGVSEVDGSAATPAIRGTDTNTGIFFPAADTIAFAEGGTESMRLDSAGNVGIGTSSPGAKLDVKGLARSSIGTGTGAGGAAYAFYQFGTSATATENWHIGTEGDGTFRFYNQGFGAGLERMRLDSSGNLLVGTTVGGSSAARGIELSAGAGNETYVRIRHEAAATSGGWFIGFQYNNNVIGNITQNGTTAVAYNTTSDYRLKENVQPMTGALAKVAALKPCTYKWKADGSEAEGFIAHELAEVVPQCVSGEKDAVDADGNPQYQGIDTSFLVATLTAAIQEQQAIIESLTARVAALEGQA